MNHGRAGRSRLTRAVLAALAWSLVPAAALAAPAEPGQVEPGEPGTAQLDPVPSFSLVSRPPWVGPEDSAPFAVSLDGDTTGASVRIELYDAVDSVEDVEESLEDDVGRRVFRSPALPLDQLAPGPDGTRVVALKTSTSSGDEFTARLLDPGVYPLVLQLADAGGTVVDEIRTPVVRLGTEDDPLPAPSLAVLLDVSAPPTLRPDGTRHLPAGRLAELARVGAVFAAHPDLDLTLAATPDTVDALGASTDPMAVELLQQLQGQDALALPYLPLAIQSLRETDLVGLVPPLVERGTTVLADRLDARLRSGIWDPPAHLDEPGAALLSQLGYDALLVSPPADEPDVDADDDAPPLVDAGPAPMEGIDALNGLVVDTALSEDLAAPLPDRPDAAHVALAELLVREDATDAEVLVRPGPLAERSTLAGLLGLVGRDGSPVHVGGLGVLERFPRPDTPAVDWEGPPAPELFDIASRVLADAARLDTFAAIIDARSSRADDLRLQIATAVAATTSERRRELAVATVEDTLQETFGAIRLAGETNLNLTSRRGTLPITVENGNPYAVNVLIRVRSDRLAFPDGQVLAATVSSDGQRIDVPVEALATGSVPVFVELWTGDDAIKLDARQLNVRSTAVTGVGVALSLGALLVLVLWWVRSWRRSRRERAATT